MLNAKGFVLSLVLLSSLTIKGQQSLFQKAKKTFNVDTAVFYGEKYLAWAIQKNNCTETVEAGCFLAAKYSIKSNYARAEKLVEKALDYTCVKKDPVLRGRLYLELAGIHKYNGSYALSLNYYHQAQNIFEKSKSWYNLVRCNVALAEYYRKLGKFKSANEFIQSAFDLYKDKKLSDTAVLIRIYNRAAAIDNESNPNPRFSIGKSKMALMLAHKSGDKDAEATSLNELGYSYKNFRKLDSAEYCYKAAEEAWFLIGADREALHAMNNRALLYAHNNYPKKKTMGVFAEMINLVNSRHIDYSLADAYSYIYTSLIREGDSARALKYFYQYHSNTVDRIRKEHDIQVTNITEKYESEKAKKEVKRVTGQLSESRVELEQKNAENRRMFFFIAVLVVLTILVAFLLLRINKTNRKLAERNKEKDVLIQEIHHRVKNNLQFISSLINMQMNSSIDDREIHTLNDASRRIRAMALVHEMLYNHKESQGISIKQYLGELVLSLDQLVNSEKIPIEFKLNFDEQNFNVSDSIALGMITSELVSNSMKHAFKDVEKPVIEVSLKKKQNDILFTVRDNGVGSGNNNGQKKTLGLRLIDIFSRQLKGKYSIDSDSGYSYQIHFTAR